MFLSNWLVFKIVLAALGRTDYPVAGDLELKYDNVNKIYLSGGSSKYIDSATLWTTIGEETTQYDIDNNLHLDTGNEQIVYASDASVTAGGQFGRSCAISGEYIIVGRHEASDVASAAGAVYILKRFGNTFVHDAKLVSPSPVAWEQFGVSVDIDGDYAIVGTSDTADRAYIFHRSGGTWSQQATLTSGTSSTKFGFDVSISGDYAVVGAYQDDTGGSDRGKAYIFKRSGTTWTQQTTIQASDAANNDQFGRSVSIDGDTIVVGANGEDDGGTDAGAAYVFTGSGSTWTEQAKLMASDKQAQDWFGWSISISGNTIVVGANQEGTGGSNAGAAYVFARSGTTWTQQAKLMASDIQASDYYAYNVSIDGDYVIVGANQEDTGGSNAGAAYVYSRSGSTWSEIKKIQASNVSAGPQFGIAVAIENGTVCIGAIYEATYGSQSGAAYIYPSQVTKNYYINEPGKYSVDATIAGLNYKTNEVEVTGTPSDVELYSEPETDFTASKAVLSDTITGYHNGGMSENGEYYYYNDWKIYKKDVGSFTYSAYGSALTSATFSKSHSSMSHDGNYIVSYYTNSTAQLHILKNNGTTFASHQIIASPNTSARTDSQPTFVPGPLKHFVWVGKVNNSSSTTFYFYKYNSSTDNWSLDFSVTDPVSADSQTAFNTAGANITGRGGVSFSRDGNYLAVAYNANPGAAVLKVDWTNQTLVLKYQNSQSGYFACFLSNDAKYFYYSTGGGTTDGKMLYSANGDWEGTPTDVTSSFTNVGNLGDHSSIFSGRYIFSEKGGSKMYIFKWNDLINPTLTFDNYNKLSIDKTPKNTSSKIFFGSNVYDIGTLTSDITIETPGVYKSITYDTTSNVAYLSRVNVASMSESVVIDRYLTIDTPVTKFTTTLDIASNTKSISYGTWMNFSYRETSGYTRGFITPTSGSNPLSNTQGYFWDFLSYVNSSSDGIFFRSSSDSTFLSFTRDGGDEVPEFLAAQGRGQGHNNFQHVAIVTEDDDGTYYATLYVNGDKIARKSVSSSSNNQFAVRNLTMGKVAYSGSSTAPTSFYRPFLYDGTLSDDDVKKVFLGNVPKVSGSGAKLKCYFPEGLKDVSGNGNDLVAYDTATPNFTNHRVVTAGVTPNMDNIMTCNPLTGNGEHTMNVYFDNKMFEVTAGSREHSSNSVGMHFGVANTFDPRKSSNTRGWTTSAVSSYGGFPHYLTVKFPEAKYVSNCFIIEADPNGSVHRTSSNELITGFTIDASTDGTSWSTKYTSSSGIGNSGKKFDLTSPGTFQYWRLGITGAPANYFGIGFWDIISNNFSVDGPSATSLAKFSSDLTSAPTGASTTGTITYTSEGAKHAASSSLVFPFTVDTNDTFSVSFIAKGMGTSQSGFVRSTANNNAPEMEGVLAGGTNFWVRPCNFGIQQDRGKSPGYMNNSDWTHYVYTLSPCGFNLYINGVLRLAKVFDSARSGTTGITTFNVNTSNMFDADGILGKFKAFSNVLDYHQVTELYHADTPGISDLLVQPDPITFDGYNKLTLSGITGATSKIHALPTGAESTTTYDIGTATNIYIDSAGTYTAEMKGSSEFVLDSNVVSTLNPPPTTAFHYDAFSASDYSGAYSTVGEAAAARLVYSDTPTGTYSWGTLTGITTTSTETTYTWTPPGNGMVADVLMVAGGGGGAGAFGGGGGAGGLLFHTSQSLVGSKTISIGNGGLGGYGHTNSTSHRDDGLSGSDTTFTNLTTAIGGGGGGSWCGSTCTPGKTGGSGGGGGHGGVGASGTSGQGYAGGGDGSGSIGGGGGGAGGEGQDPENSTYVAGDGGVGLDYSSIFGTTYGDSGWFASGGGGGSRTDGGVSNQAASSASAGGGTGGTVISTKADNAQKHTGGGGGSAGFQTGIPGTRLGGYGGSGIVLIRHSDPPSLTFDGFNKYTFTGVDTGSTYKLKYGSNTYDLGTTSNVYIKDAGTYSAEIKGATNFALSSNVVGSINSSPEPDDISGLTGWYKGSSYNTSTNQWEDVSGNNRHMTEKTGTLNINSSGINGKAYVYADRYSGIKVPTTAHSIDNHTPNYTFFFVGKWTAGSNIRGRILEDVTAGYYCGWYGRQHSGHNRYIAPVNGADGKTTSNSNITGDDWALITDFNHGFRINGTDRANATSPARGGMTQLCINNGYYNAGSRIQDYEYSEGCSWAGAEMICYNRVLTPYEISLIESYLQNKYSISNDISTSPFPSLTFDGYNKLTLSGLDSDATSNVTFDGNTYSIGTASTVYIENTGTYDAESKSGSTFALTSKVVNTVSSTILPILKFENLGTSLASNVSGVNLVSESTYTAPSYDSTNNAIQTAANSSLLCDFSSVRTSTTSDLAVVFEAYYDHDEGLTAVVTLGEYSSNPNTDFSIDQRSNMGGTIGGLSIHGKAYVIDTSLSGGTYQATAGLDAGDYKDKWSKHALVHYEKDIWWYIYVNGEWKLHMSSSQTTTSEVQDWFSDGFPSKIRVFRYPGQYGTGTYSTGTKVRNIEVYDDVSFIVSPTPKLTFDGYKLVVKNIIPTSSTLKYESNTYDIGSATNVYIKDVGTYTAEIGGATDFALLSNVSSGTVKTVEPVLAIGQKFGHALTYDGKLYGWGKNGDGDVGVGTTSNITVPTLCTGIPQGEVVSIWRQALDGGSRWAKTRDGKIWVTGDHDSYALPGSSADFTTFTDVSAEFGDHTQTATSVVYASSAARSTQVLMENGDVWSFGDDSGSTGGLGQGASPTSDRTPRKLTGISNVTKLSHDGDMTIALDSSNVVWMWGRNMLGNQTAGWGPYNVPTNIMGTGSANLTSLLVSGETVTDIESSWTSIFILTNKGTVYCTGVNTSGELGQGNQTAKTSSDGWVKIEYFTSNTITVNKLYVGEASETAFVFADTSDGWYCWGNNDQGQLGLGDTTVRLSPVKFTGVSNIKKFDVGRGSTFAITEDGKYYAWGNGAQYRRGDNATGAISYAKYIDKLPNILAPSFDFDGYDNVSCYDPELLRKVSFQSFTYNGLYCGEMDVLVKDSGTWYAWNWEFIEGANGDFTSYNRPVTDGGEHTRGQAKEWYKGAHDWRILRTSNGYKLEKVNYQSGTWGNPTGGFHIQTADTFQPDANGIVTITFSWSSITGVMFKEPLFKNGVDFSTKFTKGTTTYDAGSAQIVTVSDPGTYDAQLSKGDFAIKSATVPATSSTGLYTWAFHHGNFDNAYGDGDILTARDNGRFYADTPAYTGDIGTITPGSNYQNIFGFPLTSSIPSASDYSDVSTIVQGAHCEINSGSLKATNSSASANDRTLYFYTAADYEEFSVTFDFNLSETGSDTGVFFSAEDTASNMRVEVQKSAANTIRAEIQSSLQPDFTQTSGFSGWAKLTLECFNKTSSRSGRVKIYINDDLKLDQEATTWTTSDLKFKYFTLVGGRPDGRWAVPNARMKNFKFYNHRLHDTDLRTTYTFTPASSLTSNVLMVAGGGGGGRVQYAGGGGAGGLVYTAGTTLSGAKTIVVGNGGLIGGDSGNDTTFTNLTTAVKGGYGGDTGSIEPQDGGSGGGQAYNSSTSTSGTSGQGYGGGGKSPATSDESGGGGGGAGEAGHDGWIVGSAQGDGRGGNGGKGKFFGTGSSFTNFGDEYGEDGWFAGGGGGGTIRNSWSGLGGKGGGGRGYGVLEYRLNDDLEGVKGFHHTGGGGGGGGWSGKDGGGGGSGIVLIQTNVPTPRVNTNVGVSNDYYVHAMIEDNQTHVSYRRGAGGNGHNSGGYHDNIRKPDGSLGRVYSATGYSYINVSGADSLVSTVEGIFYPIEQKRYDGILEIGHNHSHDVELEMAEDGTAKLYRNQGGTHLASGTVKCFTAGKWHHVVLTLDANRNAVAYVNGYPVVSTTYSSAILPGSRSQNCIYRTGVGASFRKFMFYYFKTYNSVLNQNQILKLASSVGLGPKLEYDGLNTLKILNTELGSTVKLFTSNVADTSNVFIVADPAGSEYTIPEPGKYYAEIKGTDTFTITKTLDVSGTFPLYQYPPYDGTTSSLTQSASADTWSTWSISGAAHGNGQYQAKTTHSTDGTTYCAYRAFNNDIEDGNGQLVSTTKTNFGLTLQLPSAKTIRKYRMYPVDHNLSGAQPPGSSTDPTLPGNSGEDAKARPNSWVLKGSNDGTNWTDLDTVNNKPISIYGDVYSIDSPASYQYYQMFILNVVDDSQTRLRLGEWQLWGDA